VQANVSLVRDAKGRPRHLISQILDVSERRRLQEEVEHLALHDQLTGLPNSRLLLDRLAHAIATARRTKQPCGLMYLDLDGFKPVNDTYGHAAGDLVLREFADRATKVLRANDTIARVGGDEFVAVLGAVAGEPEARIAAGRLLAAVAHPFDVGGAQVAISASIGIALFPAHGEDPQTLLEHADSAMYEAKHAGKNSFRFFAGGQA
jgi:diguanylate cyclase (GGDEF)-like protein